MRTHKADLGQIAQAVWNSSQGRFVEMTDNGFVATRMTDHVEPILALISPVLWLWRDVRALLLLQVLLVSGSAWFVYDLARDRLEQLLTPRQRQQIWQIEPLRRLTQPVALALAVAYLLSPQLQSGVLTEFHAAPLAVPLILWAFWASFRHRTIQFAAAVLLLAAVKEEMALLAAGIAIYDASTALSPTLRFAMLRPRSAQLDESRGATKQSGHPVTQSPSPLFKFFTRQEITPLLLHSFSPLLLTCLCLTWFYITTFLIVPAHAIGVYGVAESGYFARYGALGNSPLDIVKSFFTQPRLVWQIATEPARLHYLGQLLAGFGFFSLLAPEILLLSAPLLLANLLSAYPAQYYGDFHYSAPLVAYTAVSATVGVGRLWRWSGRRLDAASPAFQQMPAANAVTMNAVALLQNARTALRPLLAGGLALWVVLWASWLYVDSGRGPLGGHFDPQIISTHDRLLPRFIAQIPPDAPVTATAAVHPHVALRRYVYQFPKGVDPAELSAPGFASGAPAEWALLDVTTNTDMAPGNLKERVEQMLAADWGVVDGADGFLLLQKGAASKEIPDAFYDFARAQPDEVAEVAATAAPLMLVGTGVDDWPRWRETKVVSYWRVGENFDAAMRPWLELRTPGGERLYDFAMATPPALLWYPPAAWRPGELIKVTTLALHLPRVWGVVVPVAQAPPAPNGAAQLVDATGQWALVDAYTRTAQGVVEPMAPTSLSESPASAQMSAMGNMITADFDVHSVAGSDARIVVQASVLQKRIWPGGALDLLLNWQGDVWPEELTVFVHVRRNDHNVAQSDGPPRWFVALPPSRWIETGLPDWRQLTLPVDASLADASSAGEWQVAVGLYNRNSGERMPLLDGNGQPFADELIMGPLEMGPPPLPDQACALIGETCNAQPH